MKKLLILSFLMINIIGTKAIKGATGHDTFTSIKFHESGRLLIDLTEKEIEKGYEKLGKRKFWGYKTHYFSIEEKATYIGEVIFAKANRTNQMIKVEYTLQEKAVTENSFKVTGSLTGNIEGKVKSVGLKGSASGGVTSETNDTYTRFEETTFNVNVEPFHRLIFHVTGDCLVTNGVTKYYSFWMQVNKGSWESIVVINRYYELLEVEIIE